MLLNEHLSWKIHTQTKHSCKITVFRKKNHVIIQGVPRRKVNILGGHSIGHSNKKMYMLINKYLWYSVLHATHIWKLLGFWTFPIVWYSREHDVSETGSVSFLRWRWGRRHLLTLALCKGLNWVGVFSPTFTWGRKQIQFPKRRVL
jgi:hypothetical protein